MLVPRQENPLAATPVVGSQAPTAIAMGRVPDKAGRLAELRNDDETHVLLFGPNGSGKATRFLVPNLLRMQDRSIFVIDPKGELAAITAKHRSSFSEVVIINPFGLHTNQPDYRHLKSQGFNPLAALDPESSSFNSDAGLLAEALIKTQSETQPFFDNSARALVAALIMYVVMESYVEQTVPRMDRVRELLCSASKQPSEKHPTGVGIPELAHEMILSQIRGLKNKASQFTDWNKEIQSVASSAKEQTEYFDDEEIAEDLSKPGFDFHSMKERPVTVYLILPARMMNRHARWLRLLLTSALNACMREPRPGELRSLFILDEFAALGHLEIIETTWALVRGYGIQIMPVLQDMNQLIDLYGKRWQTFIGMAGTIAHFPPNDATTANWISERAGEVEYRKTSYTTGQSNGREQTTSSGKTFSKERTARFSPQDLYGSHPGTLYLALRGQRDVIKAYAPHYFEVAAYDKLAYANPYRPK